MKSLLLLIVLLPLFSSFNVLAQTSKKTSTKTSNLGWQSCWGVDPKTAATTKKGLTRVPTAQIVALPLRIHLTHLPQKRTKTKNMSRHSRCFKRLANRGDAPSQFNVGILISRGEGAKTKISEKHPSGLKKSARRGFVPAMYLLGVYYYQGIGVARKHK